MEPDATGNARPYLLAVLLALAVGAPWLNKPYHIDDTVVLTVAKQILRDPLRPFDADINWLGDLEPLFETTTNPPLVSYYLAPFIARFGFSEVALHGAMLLFLVILALAAVELSRRFAEGSWWPVLFVMTSPAVVISNNVMRDTAMAALAAAAAALFVRGTDDDRPSLLVVGSLLAGGAVLSKYSAAILFPVLALYPLLRGRPRLVLALLPGVALIGLWCVQNVWAHGTTHLQYLMAEKRTGMPWQSHFYSGMTAIGACCFLAVPVALGTLASRSWWWVLLFVPAVPLLARGLDAHYTDAPSRWQCLVQGELGGVLLWMVGAGVVLLSMHRVWLRYGRRDREGAEPVPTQSWRDEMFLFVWMSLVVFFSVKYVMFQAVRHLIPAMVPLCLLAVRLLQRTKTPIRVVTNGALGLSLAAQVVITAWVGWADYQYADVYRHYSENPPDLVAKAEPNVWFMGSWGWAQYGLMAGWRHLATNGPVPEEGHLVVIPDRCYKGPMPPGLEERLSLVHEKTYRTGLRMFTMNGFAGASFYAVVGRNLPYLYSTEDDKLETFRVHRVGLQYQQNGDQP